MYRLEELISTLGPDEKKNLSDLHLSGKEKLLLDYFLSIPAGHEANIDEACRKIGISENHFYKISSVVLNRCYSIVAAGEMELLYLLQHKGLYSHINGAIRHQERSISDFSPQERASFYYRRFHFIMDLPFRFSDRELLERMGELYSENAKNRDEAKAYVRYHILLYTLNKNGADFNPEPGTLPDEGTIHADEKEFITKGWHLPLYYLYRCLASYHTIYQPDSEQVIHYLNKASVLTSKIRDCFSFDVELLLDLLLADALFTGGEHNMALEKYEQGLARIRDSHFAGYYYHYEQYILLLIIQGNYDKAEEVLKNVFDPPVKARNDIYATRGLITSCKLNLSKGNLPAAMEALREANQLNEKSAYLPFDIQLRTLEMIYFILKGNCDFARQLGRKNQKLLKSKKGNQQFSQYMHAWKYIAACGNGERKTILEKEERENLDSWFSNVYGDLLKKLEISG